MNTLSPYLRVVAGFFAALCTWLAIVSVVQLDFGQVVVFLIFAAGLSYVALAKPLRERAARTKAANAALAARADAANAAFLAGDTRAALAPPPSPEVARPVRKGVVVAAVVAAAFLLIGIVADIADGLEASTEDETPASAAQLSTGSPAAPSPVAAVPAAPVIAEPAAAAVPVAAPAASALMPAVVCMNLQSAQDTIQAAGVFYSRSEDATGAGRMQISDRNWVVVGQRPDPGTPIGEGDAMLSVVKIGERGDCS
ncbi:hypothetical protein OG921_20390 [Aldersonia sp. NBC_00410]|uniref:hypothetical protein n=1 Tax=Aldersonia sp. NBC_00410 TaxID=2975954 RepID=UPI00225456F7|nr:hypothetical protein [Aldersonia sp. NBC_00410]MCX5045528.1 hypothetical protein [Aldersonia sp. NBC_00410]